MRGTMDFYDSLTLVLALVLVLALFKVLGSVSRRARKLPPGPAQLPLIGNLHLLGALPHKSLAKLSETYGPIMCLKLGQMNTVVISSPALAKEVLQKRDLAFSSRFVPDALSALDHGKYSVVWTPVAAPKWRSQRKILNHNIFSSNRLDANQHLRSAKIQELIAFCRKYSQSGEAVDIGHAAFMTTLNLLSNTIFSKNMMDPYSDSGQEMKELVTKIMVEAGKPNLVDYFPVLEKVDPQGYRRRMTLYFREVLKLFGGLIDERLVQKNLRDTKYDDMLEVLLATSEEHPKDIDRIHIEHLFLDLFAAGTDTTSNTVDWAMAEVLKNPRVMKNVEEELTRIIGRGKPLEEHDISRLPYLNCIVKETFRLHPPVPFLLPRKAEEAVEVCGYRVPKGSQVLINVWAIGRDENVWEDPLTFNPERFWQSDIDVRGCDFELIPFGAGRRVCPGLALAYRMVPLMLGSLLNSFNWKLVSEELDMEEKHGLSLIRAHPLLAIPISPQTSC